MSNKTPIVIVAGLSKQTKAIGNNNELLWHVPDDLKRFKALTLGHPIIMGRKTFESIIAILGKPLPGRTNIIISRDTTYAHEGAVVCASLEEAIEVAESESPAEIHIGGGAQLYEQILPQTDRLHLTLYDDPKEGDTYFPDYEALFEIVEAHEPREHNGLSYQWVDLVKKKSA